MEVFSQEETPGRHNNLSAGPFSRASPSRNSSKKQNSIVNMIRQIKAYKTAKFNSNYKDHTDENSDSKVNFRSKNNDPHHISEAEIESFGESPNLT